MSLCRPRSTGSELTESVRLIRQRYSETFARPIDSVLNKIRGTGKRSPIAEALLDVSLSHYLAAPRNTIVVFSDLLENTDRFSMYNCSSPEHAISAFRESRGGGRPRPAFRNTKIYLNIIPRMDYRPEVWHCRDVFWAWFFGDDTGEGAGVSTSYLPGGPVPRP
jgi:hypothetical protein